MTRMHLGYDSMPKLSNSPMRHILICAGTVNSDFEWIYCIEYRLFI